MDGCRLTNPMSTTQRTIRSTDPARRSLVVTVQESALFNLAGGLPKQGTSYSDQKWRTLSGFDYKQKFSDFNYVQQLGDASSPEGQFSQLLFAKPCAVDEGGSPIPFRTYTRFGNHYWHTILLKLEPVLVRGFPLSTQTGTSTVSNANRYVIREVYIPAATEGTRFVTDEFFSDQQFNIPTYETPIASALTYDIQNRRGGFPECLHKRLVFPSVPTVSGERLPEQVFPETNFTEWESYILSDEQTLTESGWHRIRVRVYPPDPGDAVIKLAR